MKKFSLLIAAIVLAGAALAQDYAFVELYPNGAPFIGAGKSNQVWKIDAWCTAGSEIAATVGPVIGPFAIGFGGSFGDINGQTEVTYLNADLGFGFNFAGFHWQSYSWAQIGQKGLDDFLLSRNFFHLITNDNYGVVSHNTKTGGNAWHLFLGPYYNIGQMKVFSSNRLCLTVDLKNQDNVWVAWIINF